MTTEDKIWIGGGIALAIGGGIYYFVQKNKNDNEISQEVEADLSNETLPVATPKPIRTPTLATAPIVPVKTIAEPPGRTADNFRYSIGQEIMASGFNGTKTYDARKMEDGNYTSEGIRKATFKKGDKIAVCGRNSSHWGVTFLATITYGAVIVPILHEFKADNIHNIVNHSEARLLLVGDMVWENLNENAMPLLEGVLLMNDFTLLVSRSERLDYARDHLNELFGKKFPRNFRREHVSYRRDKPEELAVINYTSGTTSYSKGVMIPYRALWSNTQFAFDVLTMKPGDKLVSMLPMAHMYGLAFEFLYEFCVGCHIYFLTRMPSPKIIFQAFADIKPNLVVAVPLIIEKIIKKNVLPKLESPAMKILLKVPIINDKIKATVREQMIQAFGGNFAAVIVGGAAFNQEVEQFLKMIDFPYTVGYGMT